MAKSLLALLYAVHPLDAVAFITADSLVALAAGAIPATRAASTNHGIDAPALIHGLGSANYGGIGRRAGGIVAAGHLHFDIAVALLG